MLPSDGLKEMARWYDRDRAFALCTITETWRSAPCPPGTMMAVSAHGGVLGSLSGGCVEGAVHEVAQQAIRDGRTQLLHYGVSDADAFEVGLTCGGSLDIVVSPIGGGHFPEFPELAEAVDRGVPVCVATIIERGASLGRRIVVTDGHVSGSLGGTRLNDVAARICRGMLAAGSSGVVRLGADGEQLEGDLRLFVHTFNPAPRLLVFGAIDFASAVARIGKFLGYHVTVCDARATFATSTRFPDADEVVVDWPHRYLAKAAVDERTAICCLTHDPKFDVPLLQEAVRTSAAYIGAMGSRRTHADRVRRLRAAGVTETELDRISSPIGLDLGARTPEETAVSIAAELIALKSGGSGLRLRLTEGPLHGQDASIPA